MVYAVPGVREESGGAAVGARVEGPTARLVRSLVLGPPEEPAVTADRPAGEPRPPSTHPPTEFGRQSEAAALIHNPIASFYPLVAPAQSSAWLASRVAAPALAHRRLAPARPLT